MNVSNRTSFWDTFEFGTFAVTQSVGACLGAIGLVLNILFAYTVLRSPKLRRKFTLPLALCAADLASCLDGLLSTLIRLLSMAIDRDLMVRRATCLFNPTLFLELIGGLMPSLIVVLIAVERYVAIRFPLHYRSDWGRPRLVKLAVCAYSFGLCAIAACYLEVFVEPEKEEMIAFVICEKGPAAGARYNTLSFVLVVLLSITSVVFAFMSLAAIRVHSNQVLNAGPRHEKSQYRRELKITKPMLFTAFSLFLLVTLPNVVFVVIMVAEDSLKREILNYAWLLKDIFLLNSCLLFLFFLNFCAEFRNAFNRIVRKAPTAVHPSFELTNRVN